MKTRGKWQNYLRGALQKSWVLALAIFLFSVFTFYLFFLNYTEPTEVGIARNFITGEMWIQKGGGWWCTSPWVRVARIDIRPVRVTVPSAGHGYSAKLVQFQPDAWQEFVAVEGFRYWWWANRFSFNFGYDEEYRGMRDILRGHAYGTKKYSFFKVITEYE